MAISLGGRVAVITGGARGVGLATGRLLAARGATVAFADLDGERARAAAEGIAGARGYGVDVADRASFSELIATATQDLGPVDVLVNNAAVMALRPFLELDEPTIRRQ